MQVGPFLGKLSKNAGFHTCSTSSAQSSRTKVRKEKGFPFSWERKKGPREGNNSEVFLYSSFSYSLCFTYQPSLNLWIRPCMRPPMDWLRAGGLITSSKQFFLCFCYERVRIWDFRYFWRPCIHIWQMDKLSSQTNIKAGINLPETRQLIGINMTLFICWTLWMFLCWPII